VLIMIACQFGHPIAEFVLMETDYGSFHGHSTGLRLIGESHQHPVI
jgi:hypothetical protein